jgi:hypothetical protein
MPQTGPILAKGSYRTCRKLKETKPLYRLNRKDKGKITKKGRKEKKKINKYTKKRTIHEHGNSDAPVFQHFLPRVS